MHGWRDDCCSKATQSSTLHQKLLILYVIVMELELGDEVNFLFHEFCLDLITWDQLLFLMMTEQISKWTIHLSLTVQHGVFDKCQLVQSLEDFLFGIKNLTNKIVTSRQLLLEDLLLWRRQILLSRFPNHFFFAFNEFVQHLLQWVDEILKLSFITATLCDPLGSGSFTIICSSLISLGLFHGYFDFL